MKKIIFFGTSEFAVPALRALAQDTNFEISGIVTQPDRPTGRHAVLTMSPVKKESLALSITEIHQPVKIKDEEFSTWIKNIGPSCDAFVVVSYGKILPQWLLDLPKNGVINVHGSLLPRWRGASPIHTAIAAGDTLSGITIMLIDADMDHGPLLALQEEPILPTDTYLTLHTRLADIGGNILPKVLLDFLNGQITPQEQQHDSATYCKILEREDGKLDTTKSAVELERLVRAYQPWPGTWIDLNGTRLKILEARVGTMQPALACAHGTSLQLLRVQPEGKKPMTGEEFLRGAQNHKLFNKIDR